MFNITNMAIGLVFSLIGLGALRYGRAMKFWKPLAIGLALMIYPFFTPNWMWTLAAGLALSGTLWFHHDE